MGALAAASVAATCGGDKPPSVGKRTPYVSSRDLMLMLLPPEEIDYAAVEVAPGSGQFGNAAAAASSVDPDDTARDLRDQGRVTGALASYWQSPDIPRRRPDLDGITVSVQRFESDAAATQWMAHEIAMLQQQSGKELGPGATLVQVSPFFVTGVVEGETEGVEYAVSTSGETYYLTVVFFTHGDLLGMTGMVRKDDYDVGLDVAALASRLRSRMVGVLDGTVTGDPIEVPSPEEYAARFERGTVLGLRCSYASKFLRSRYALPDGPGCVILRVAAKGGAENSGLRIGDKIVELNGRPITSGRQFTYEYEDRRRPDSGPTFVVERKNERLTIDVTLSLDSDPPVEDPYADYLFAKGNDDIEEGIRYYTLAIEQDPDFDLAYAYRGDYHWRPGGLGVAAAEADYAKALSLDPDVPETLEGYARMLAFAMGDYEGALGLIDRAIGVAGCVAPIASWDLDCGQFLIARAQIRLERYLEGDDAAAEADILATANVEGLTDRRDSAYSMLGQARYNAAIRNGTCTKDGVEVPCEFSER